MKLRATGLRVSVQVSLPAGNCYVGLTQSLLAGPRSKCKSYPCLQELNLVCARGNHSGGSAWLAGLHHDQLQFHWALQQKTPPDAAFVFLGLAMRPWPQTALVAWMELKWIPAFGGGVKPSARGWEEQN